MNYKEFIKKHDEQGEFNNAEHLIDFIDSYCGYKNPSPTLDELKDDEDNITEFADNLVPVYNYDIIEEWRKNSDAQEMTLEVEGEYGNQKDGIIKMMMSDLFYYYDKQLREDYNRFIELAEEEEEAK